MFVEEWLAKSIIADAGIPVPRGRVATSPEEAREAARDIGAPVVVKAQVPFGRRGKLGGIRFASDEGEAEEAAGQLLGRTLTGFAIQRVLVEERVSPVQEFYSSICVDNSRRRPLVLFSPQGGVEVEEMHAVSPQSMCRRYLDVRRDLTHEEALAMIADLSLTPAMKGRVAATIERLGRLHAQLDAELLEINPLAVLSSGELVALDCKLVIDDSSLPRQPRFAVVPDSLVGTELERRAKKLGLTYVQLDGEVGILANGAGLAMYTMDLVAHCGGTPANFIDIGGGAYERGEQAVSIVLAHPRVRSLFVNLCGAFARTDVMAEGIVNGLLKTGARVPLVFSIHGTGSDEARKLVRTTLGIEPYPDVEEAAKRAVRLATGSGGDDRLCW